MLGPAESLSVGVSMKGHSRLLPTSESSAPAAGFQAAHINMLSDAGSFHLLSS